MKRKTYTTLAAIHLGSEMLRLRIVEYRSLNRVKTIEQCDYPIRLGEEAFKNKSIPFPMVEEICQVLQGFKELMQDYGVDVYTAQATTAVREASNKIFLLDQIKLRTDMDVTVAEMPMEIYTKYVAIRKTLRDSRISSEKGMMLLDISSGGLGVSLVQDEKICFQENFHIGIIRIKESFNNYQRSSLHFNKALMQFLSSTIGPVRKALEGQDIKYLVLSGTETELLLKVMGIHNKNNLQRVTTEEFRQFFDKVRKLNLTQLLKTYHLTETEAELVLPMVLLYEKLLDLAPSAKEIIITKDTFLEGMILLHIIREKDETYTRMLEEEKMSLVHHVGEDYEYDYNHVTQVERLALIIFDRIGKKYGLDDHCRLLLRAAAILHDIGKYVSMRSHSLYSYQLIMGTDLLGFTEEDKQVIAMASYYHAHNVLERDEKRVPALKSELVPVVAKLSAIIRLADALDRSYMQKIQQCRVTLHNRELTIEVVSKADLDLEEWTFASKVLMMEEVYGFKVRLERVESL